MERTFRYLVGIFLILSFVSCSNLNLEKKEKNQWVDSREWIINAEKLKIGDILIKQKVLTNPMSWFGHVGIMVAYGMVGEYPRRDVGYIEVPVEIWLNEDRKIIVKRYKYFDKKFEKNFLGTIKRYRNRQYKLSFDKNDGRNFYCSSYVWQMYLRTAKRVKDKNFDMNFKKENLFIYPYDFIDIPNFENIEPVEIPELEGWIK